MDPLRESKAKLQNGRIHCYHCGEICPHSQISIGEKRFCCNGCKLVFELLEEKDLCAYYSLTQTPGTTPAEAGIASRFEYLDDDGICRQLLSYSDHSISKISFNIPAIHCSSCIWLLENLYRVEPGISASKVNFLRRELSLTYVNDRTNLRKIVETLASIGYEPAINLASLKKEVQKNTDKELYLQIGVAGFAFGNIMLLSFPEYLAGDDPIDQTFLSFFGYISIFLALPVLFYSSLGYFRSAIISLKQKTITMDVPISLGILTLFVRSVYHILAAEGTGYMDSFTALVFLLLIGKLFQKKTYDTLSFDRDYRSYFPLAITIRERNSERTLPLEKIKIGDRLILRHNELIPADSILIKGPAVIDYSFVTGESTPVEKISGDMLYAGGMNRGGQIEMEVVKEVSQSYLTQLWNDDAFNKSANLGKMTGLSTRVSKYFTFAVLLIATLAAFYWLPGNISLALNAFTAVLIVACPCALALSTPFTLGNTLRILGKNKFYLKNVSVIEGMAKIDTIIFDKTGTLTQSTGHQIRFFPAANEALKLTADEIIFIRSLVRQSTHPLSQRIYTALPAVNTLPVSDFAEKPGKGLSGFVSSNRLRIGSADFIDRPLPVSQEEAASSVLIEINGIYRGHFNISNRYRQGIRKMIEELSSHFKIFLLSGDNETERPDLIQVFDGDQGLFFNQSPYDKLAFIKNLQMKSQKVMMIGDGLNDAGALRQSDIGISLSENINSFTPASDGIIDAGHFAYLPRYLKFSRISIKIILISFLISFFYNLAGLFFAVQGTLSPLIAAILMPASSLTVVLFTIGSTAIIGKKLGLHV
jgi:Cu+-exporting ATPase